MPNLRVTALSVLLAAAALPPVAPAQQFTISADVVSRYVWRGTDFGESASIQPALALNTGGLEIGTWASYAMNPESADANEHDLWISYSAGPLTAGITDYYFPNSGAGFFDFDGAGDGAHYIEPFVQLSGPPPLPLTFFAGYFAHNDPDHSVFLAASYPLTIYDVDLELAVGASAVESAMYGTSGFGIVDMSLAATRELPITDQFALPISVAYILNPYAEKSFLVVGLSL